MARKPYWKHTITHFKVKVKNLKKGDRLHGFGSEMKVLSVFNNANKETNVNLETRSNGVIYTTFPSKMKVTVTKRKNKSFPKNR